MSLTRSRVALVHDWFVAPGGAESVAIELATVLPGADVFTSFITPEHAELLADHVLHTWPLQRMVGPTRQFRAFLPLYPMYFSRLDVRAYDLVVSSSIAFSHAVRTAPRALHIAYVYTPVRYAWDLETYLKGSSLPWMAQAAARAVARPLRSWDRRASARPDVVVAISRTVRDRIAHHWGREAEVIYPPVDVDKITISTTDEGFLLVAARMLAYRRLDLAVEACTSLGRDLVIVGDGPEMGSLRAKAGPSVRFVGRVDRETVLDLFARCHGYIVPGVEDFGIAPVEAMAAGKAVIALAAGGVTETVVSGVTGVFFEKPTVASLAAAIEHFDSVSFDASKIRENAERFSAAAFRMRFGALLQQLGVDPALYSTEPRESAATISPR